MYFDHTAVDDYNEMIAYEKYRDKLGLGELSTDDIVSIRNRYQDCILKYGKCFSSDYGWYNKLPKDRISFYDLEKDANLDYLKPYYKMSCNKIHATSKSLLAKLGNLPSDLAYPLMQESFIGLLDPIQLSVLSFLSIANSYLINLSTPYAIVNMKIIASLSERMLDILQSSGYFEVFDNGNIEYI